MDGGDFTVEYSAFSPFDKRVEFTKRDAQVEKQISDFTKFLNYTIDGISGSDDEESTLPKKVVSNIPPRSLPGSKRPPTITQVNNQTYVMEKCD